MRTKHPNAYAPDRATHVARMEAAAQPHLEPLHMTTPTIYKVSLPNDHGSEDEHALLIDAFLQERGGGNDFDPSDLSEWAFDELHSLWPGLVRLNDTDSGAFFRTTTAQPADLPRYYWVEQVDAATV